MLCDNLTTVTECIYINKRGWDSNRGCGSGWILVSWSDPAGSWYLGRFRLNPSILVGSGRILVSWSDPAGSSYLGRIQLDPRTLVGSGWILVSWSDPAGFSYLGRIRPDTCIFSDVSESGILLGRIRLDIGILVGFGIGFFVGKLKSVTDLFRIQLPWSDPEFTERLANKETDILPVAFFTFQWTPRRFIQTFCDQNYAVWQIVCNFASREITWQFSLKGSRKKIFY